MKLKGIIPAPLFLFLGILLTGCPYESPVPIDTPNIKVDPKYLGTWEELQDHEFYKVTKQDEYNYTVSITGKKDNKVENNIAYLSVVNGATFLNLREDKPGDSEKRYSLYKIEMGKGDTLRALPVTSNIREQFNSSSALKKYISANMANSYFFDPDMVLVRKNQ